eukprot:TRINITY_DN2074_c0_g1_i1.p1 TRINITY_DN2074_c0_g1~~TRINITY_DN2074_c0_g1_i1.p1  ORF type:complete len:627 (+),score=108.15 TRINITY_DN2074_c0_g1_i1:52-1932(+)
MACESPLSVGVGMSAEESDRLGKLVAEAVSNGVANVVPSEMQQFKIYVDKIMSRLDELADIFEKEPPAPSRSAQFKQRQPAVQKDAKTRTWTGQLGLAARDVIRDAHGGSSLTARGTLKEVSDHLFTEILNAKDPAASHEPSGSGSRSEITPDRGKLPPLEEAHSAYVVPGTSPSPFTPSASCITPSGAEFTDVAASALPGRVGPAQRDRCDANDASDDPSGSDVDPVRSLSLVPNTAVDASKIIRRTATAASQKVQSTIIRSCPEDGKVVIKRSFMPVIGWMLSRCQFSKCMVMLLLLFAATRIMCLARGSPMVYLVRDISAFFFALAGLVSSRMLPEALVHTESLLRWATASSCVDDWIEASRKKQHVLVWWWIAVLLLVVVVEMMIAYHAVVFTGLLSFEIHEAAIWIGCEVTSLLTFVASSALLLSASAIQCHIIAALNVFVDEWSCELCENRDFFDSVLKWNTVQALIRRAGTSIENVFATIQVWAALGLGVVAIRIIIFASQSTPSWEGLTDFKNILDLCTTLPLLMLAILAGHLLLQCSYITEKCIILPPIANQIMTEAFDVDRSYLVDYLSNSAAGIYVKGVKLDMLMVTNIAYFLCVTISAFFGIAMRLSNNSGSSV